MRLLPSGERAVLVELSDLDEVLALAGPVQGVPGVEDVVPGERTLLVTVDGTPDLASVLRALAELAPLVRSGALSGPVRPATEGLATATRTLEVPVTYDGPDLEAVAAHTGLSVAEVVEAHQATTWRVGFGGFAPGFAYLVGGDPRLEVPRRSEPRASVAAGAVGLAGRYSGIYPRSSPGGWQLIGHTDAVLFDVDRDPPALLHPGMSVQFANCFGS